jgi:hypothetical protein
MNGNSALSRADKVSGVSAASPTGPGSTPRASKALSPTSPRSAEAVAKESSLWKEPASGSGLAFSIKVNASWRVA